jgi:hypothetical protein
MIQGKQNESMDNLIQDCVVTNFYNITGHGKSSGISLARESGNGVISGIVEGCKVYFTGTEFAYNGHRTDSAIYRNNQSFTAQRGFNNDTPYHSHLSMHDNTFSMADGKTYGMYLVNGTRWSRIFNNTIHLMRSDNLDPSGIIISGHSPSTNTANYGGSEYLLIHGNKIHSHGNGTHRLYGFNCNAGLGLVQCLGNG